MKTITFTCETITPMFLAGADGQTPELRAPSIKGAMRFWWRAMRAHEFTTAEDLRRAESTWLGGAGDTDSRQSAVSIRVKNNAPLRTRDYPLVPHKSFTTKAIDLRQEFEVIISVNPSRIAGQNIEAGVLLERAKNLFILTSILGGLGRRSRRGMGSYYIKAIDGQAYSSPSDIGSIEKLIHSFNKHYTSSLGSSIRILSNTNAQKAQYPYIKEIKIGRNDSRVLGKISQVTHDLKKQFGRAYEAVMGHVSRRFASPVYVSVLPGNKPIITKLHTESDMQGGRMETQDEFIEQII